MHFFDHVKKAPPDPIFGVRIAFEKDPRKEKVNLGVGIYKSVDLKTPILSSVKKAEAFLLEHEKDKEYLPIGGDPQFLEEVIKLVLGNIEKERVAAIHTVGGTAALCIGGRFLFDNLSSHLALSDPTWENHHRIFSNLGYEISTFPYYDKQKNSFDKEAAFLNIQKLKKKTLLFLQGSCHNPTGFDPTFAEWEELAEIVKERELLVFFDVAYQGFGDSFEEDVKAVRYFISAGIPVAIAYSFSKNFGLYAERVGSLLIVAQNAEEKERIESQLKVIVRSLYSNPPCHGGRIVHHILKDKELKTLWESEVLAMRTRIGEMRGALYAALSKLSPKNQNRFAFLMGQKGMFSYTGLNPTQVEKLTSKFGIYLLKEGRINVSGLNEKNLPYVAEAINSVCALE